MITWTQIQKYGILIYTGILMVLYPFAIVYVLSSAGVSDETFNQSGNNVLVGIVAMLLYPYGFHTFLENKEKFGKWLSRFLNLGYLATIVGTLLLGVLWFYEPDLPRAEPAIFLFSLTTLWIAYIRQHHGLSPVKLI